MEVHEIEDDDDEFEPLFDYQRVCRPPSDDDSDEEVMVIDGKTWQSSTKWASSSILSSLDSNTPSGKGTDKEADDDCDWLPPPPKSAKLSIEAKILEDPTFLELRQKREELMFLTASSEAALKKLKENNRENVLTLGQADFTPDCAHKLCSDKREKVLVSIQNKDGAYKAFRIYADDKFEKLFLMYAESISKSSEELFFSFDGQQIAGGNTPNGLGIENEDIIEVKLRTCIGK